MTTLLAALLGLSLALLVQRIVLRGRARQLRAQEQSFRFHAIRDELQMLALSGIVRQDASTYQLLMDTANLCIRNAGVISLGDMLTIGRAVDSKVPNYQEFVNELQRQPQELQLLAGETFEAVAEILVANDRFVRFGVLTATVIKPLLRPLRGAVDRLAHTIVPGRAEVVEHARKYHEWGNRLVAAA